MKGRGKKGTGREPPVVFSRPAATRIVRAVQSVERGDGTAGAGYWPFRGGDEPAGLRLGKAAADWEKGHAAEVTIYTGEPGAETAVSGPEGKVQVWNRWEKIKADRWVLVGEVNGKQEVVAWERAEPFELDVVIDAALTNEGLVFERRTIKVLERVNPDPSTRKIPVHECPPDPAP